MGKLDAFFRPTIFPALIQGIITATILFFVSIFLNVTFQILFVVLAIIFFVQEYLVPKKNTGPRPVWEQPNTIFITGGASGLGKGLAEEYINQGARIIILSDINTESLKKTSQELLLKFKTKTSNNPDEKELKIVTQTADVTNREEMKKVLLHLHELYTIDVVVCNAGIAPHQFPHLTHEEQHYLVQDINVRGVMNTFFPLKNAFRQRKTGQFIIMSSASGFMQLIGTSYPSSKAWAMTFGRTCRQELAYDNVSVVTCCPGFVSTPLIQKLKKEPPAVISVETFSQRVVQAAMKNESTLLFPWFVYCVQLFMNAMGPQMADIFAYLAHVRETYADLDLNEVEKQKNEKSKVANVEKID
jgi:NAD(P)-dependent dehydrogenase (short-subunit alcohol dehydrogenase family)